MSTSIPLQDTRYGYTEEQISVIKATIAPGATNDELALFLTVAQKSGLDPFSRQIYLSERRIKDPRTDQWISKKTPETTIDGFRVIAERSGEYQGQAAPFWCGDDRQWKDIWLSLDKMPSAAKVGVLRKNFQEPVWGIALFAEYVQTTKDGSPNSMWKKMGANQLAKCAESLALRKAFPRDLSGMYSKEEMGQAEERHAALAPMEVAQRQIEANNARMLAAGTIKEPITVANPITAQVNVNPGWSPSTQDAEQRHAALVMEAAEILDQPPTPKAERKRGAISFKALKAWGEAKKAILAATGTTDLYYAALRSAGYEHADEIRTEEEAKTIWKDIKAVIKRFTAEKQDGILSTELQKHALRLGDQRFMEILGSNGFETVDEFLNNANGVQTQAFLSELNAAE